MQIEVRPMTATAWARHKQESERSGELVFEGAALSCAAAPEMGFAAGGRMRQEIYEDPYQADEWADVALTCGVWVCNSLAWRAITHEKPPTEPHEPRVIRGHPRLEHPRHT